MTERPTVGGCPMSEKLAKLFATPITSADEAKLRSMILVHLLKQYKEGRCRDDAIRLQIEVGIAQTRSRYPPGFKFPKKT